MKSRGRALQRPGALDWTGTSNFHICTCAGFSLMWNENFLFPVFSTYQLNNEHCDQQLSDI